MSQSFAEHVSAVSPMGDAIDGSPRKHSRRSAGPRRERPAQAVAFFCSNPQCDHGTWSPAEQARHMAREFWDVAQALVRLAPESPEAARLTGGVILRDLTNDECRDAAGQYATLRARAGGVVEAVPVEIRLRRSEYGRRMYHGQIPRLTVDELAARRRERSSAWASASNAEVRGAVLEYGRLYRAGKPIPRHLSEAQSEYSRRRKNGQIPKLTREQRLNARHSRRSANLLELTDEDARAAYLTYRRHKRRGEAPPQDVVRKSGEYLRRVRVGEIARDGPQRELRESDWVAAADEYAAGATLGEIASRMGISNRRIRDGLAARGVAIRKPGQSGRASPRPA